MVVEAQGCTQKLAGFHPCGVGRVIEKRLCSSDSRLLPLAECCNLALATLSVSCFLCFPQVSDTQGLRAAKINLREVGRVIDDAFPEMTFTHGFVHLLTAAFPPRPPSLSCSPHR